MASFWETFSAAGGPGMIGSAGLNWYAGNQARKEEEKMAAEAAAAGRPYQAAAQQQLAAAGTFDPAAQAKQRFEQEQALQEPGREAERIKLMRELQAKGMLGYGSFMPTAGAAPGTQTNPMFSSLLAAQEASRQKSASESLDKGQAYLDNLLKRSAGLQVAGQTAQGTQRGAQPQVRRSDTTSSVIKGLGGLLGNKEAMKSVTDAIGGLFGNQDFSWLNASAPAQTDWLRRGLGSWSAPTTRVEDWI